MMHDVPNVLNHAPDDPRLLLSEPFRAVHFVFGLFYPEPRPLPGRAVLGALAAVGFGDGASRGILLRLRRGGFLVSVRSGRTANYTLSGSSLVLVGEISRRATEAPPPWQGTFETLIVGIPPARRAFREQFRRHASYAGLGSPMSGLYIATDAATVAGVEPLLAKAPAGVTVTRGRLAVGLDEARRLAGEAWRLAPLAERLGLEADRMAAAAREAEASPPTGAAALALLWRSIGPFFELLSEGRSLPAELLPDDWPLARANTEFGRLALVAADPARAYLEELATQR
jgi:phenylacetic acid degradation operon negative regulatory protein